MSKPAPEPSGPPPRANAVTGLDPNLIEQEEDLMSKTISAPGQHSAAQAAVLPLARVIERDMPGGANAVYIPSDRVIFLRSGMDEVTREGVIREVMEVRPAAAERSACHFAWCATGQHDLDHLELPGDSMHMSEPQKVPVADRGHRCGYTTMMGDGYVCPEESVSAWLVNFEADDEGTLLEICHGDDLLPRLTLAAAEALANGILELVRQGRKDGGERPAGYGQRGAFIAGHTTPKGPSR